MGGLRVLLIGPYPSEDGKVVGGVEAVTTILAQSLADREEVEHVAVLSFIHGGGTPRKTKVSDRLQVWQLRGQDRLSLPTRLLLEVVRARRVASELKPDIVHGQGIGSQGHIATSICDHAVVTAHGLIHKEVRLSHRGRLIDAVRVRLTDRLVRSSLRRAAVVISTSQYDARALDAWIRGRIVSVPNPVPSEFFAEFDLDAVTPHVLFAGMMLPRKNVRGLVRAFGHVRGAVPRARLVIAGPPCDRAYLSEVRREVNSLRLAESVEFLGHVDNGALLKEIRDCAIVVLFSDEETSPTIVAQAMATGKPVVASRVGGVPEMVINGETGYLVDAGDEQALAAKLTSLLTSPHLSRGMGARGREIAWTRYRASEVARRTIEAYRTALES